MGRDLEFARCSLLRRIAELVNKAKQKQKRAATQSLPTVRKATEEDISKVGKEIYKAS